MLRHNAEVDVMAIWSHDLIGTTVEFEKLVSQSWR
jgi:hypothetical protein